MAKTSIRTFLESAVEVPVKRPDYKGDAPQYITYHLYGQTGTIYAESTEAETGTEFMISIWSKTDYTELLHDVKWALLNAHWRVTVEAEYFDSDSGYYRVILDAACVGESFG